MFKRLFASVLFLCTILHASATTWLQPPPNTTIGPRDVWYFANTNPVWMHTLWIGGNNGTNGHLYINGHLFDDTGAAQLEIRVGALETNLNTEVTNRINGDISLANQIIVLSNNFTLVITNLQAQLALETTNRIAADASLSNLFINLNTQITNTSNSLNNAIGLEVTNRILADAALSNMIGNISVTNLGNVTISNIIFNLDNSTLNSSTNLATYTFVNGLSNSFITIIGLETTNRINADATLSNEIANVVTNITPLIGIETTNRINADSALSNLVNGTSNSLNLALGVETTNRINADAALSNLISNISVTNLGNVTVSNITFSDNSTLNSSTNLATLIQLRDVSNGLNNAIGLETTNRINTWYSGMVNGYYSNLVVNDLYPTNTVNFNQKDMTNVAGIKMTGPLELTDTTNSYIQFPPLSVEPSYRMGRVFFETNTSTLAYFPDNSNVTMNIGQEMWVRGKNTSGAIISNGQPVHISGSTGIDPQFDLAQASTNFTANESYAMGVATHDMAINEFGYVTTVGLVHELDTSAFVVGMPVYLGTNRGELTQTLPPEGYTRRVIGIPTRIHANHGTLFINPRNVVDFTLGTRLGIETTNRINADAALTNYIGLISTNLINTSNSLNLAIGAETTNRIDSDTAISNLVINTSNTLNLAIGLESTNRINADSSLSNLIAGIIVVTTNVPLTTSTTGVVGTIKINSNYVYVCIQTNLWKRIALTSW